MEKNKKGGGSESGGEAYRDGATAGHAAVAAAAPDHIQAA